MHDICTIYTRYIHDICTIYARYIHDIYTIYTRYIHDICTIYARYMHDIYTIDQRLSTCHSDGERTEARPRLALSPELRAGQSVILALFLRIVATEQRCMRERVNSM